MTVIISYQEAIHCHSQDRHQVGLDPQVTADSRIRHRILSAEKIRIFE